uniref:Uncharacterized protein n=1 Tax=Tetraselmis sp. GSL018 TaxID=582737 RepID=A0A061S925_9CHLO|mmetsp:Transcript_30330/g.72159  ORF Transcript_30330/g.72159 Transcript_30330/m.72159 type:complete len:199 (-) Transcript_30330:182-778(-)|eukprot:CAMPEP_0177599622 /NCGR_PEP_ID=MMETSP0419_2-20121207/13101_1 /TAXON_ID=582737 /ORGANISM="Tetraselmis sp., Strain GSL018" /LENGTH=198 /DNA_ID=CAMNT_0019092387 /DNA_START=135 /DNA_END=731 /DNA_ORIENTATION=-
MFSWRRDVRSIILTLLVSLLLCSRAVGSSDRSDFSDSEDSSDRKRSDANDSDGDEEKTWQYDTVLKSSACYIKSVFPSLYDDPDKFSSWTTFQDTYVSTVEEALGFLGFTVYVHARMLKQQIQDQDVFVWTEINFVHTYDAELFSRLLKSASGSLFDEYFKDKIGEQITIDSVLGTSIPGGVEDKRQKFLEFTTQLSY